MTADNVLFGEFPIDPVDAAAMGAAEELELTLREVIQHRGTVRLDVLNCVECGGKIPAVRRKALPGVNTCISCKRDEERPRHIRSAGSSEHWERIRMEEPEDFDVQSEKA